MTLFNGLNLWKDTAKEIKPDIAQTPIDDEVWLAVTAAAPPFLAPQSLLHPHRLPSLCWADVQLQLLHWQFGQVPFSLRWVIISFSYLLLKSLVFWKPLASLTCSSDFVGAV